VIDLLNPVITRQLITQLYNRTLMYLYALLRVLIKMCYLPHLSHNNRYFSHNTVL